MDNKENKELFPTIKRSIENYIDDQEGNISRKKMLSIGAMMILMTTFFTIDAFAAHRSHSSHSSHRSHSSHSSHTSAANHYSHASHSNAAHANYQPAPVQTPTPTPEPTPIPHSNHVNIAVPTIKVPNNNPFVANIADVKSMVVPPNTNNNSLDVQVHDIEIPKLKTDL